MNFLKKLFSKKVAEEIEVPPEFLQENSADWLVDLKGRGLPGGNAFSIRVQLFQELRTGNADIVVLPRNESEQLQTATTELLRPEIDKLFVILGFSFPHEIGNVPSDVVDGLPINVSIYKNEPFILRVADCNLAGWLDSRKSGPPIVEIGRILMDARNRALPV